MGKGQSTTSYWYVLIIKYKVVQNLLTMLVIVLESKLKLR